MPKPFGYAQGDRGRGRPPGCRVTRWDETRETNETNETVFVGLVPNKAAETTALHEGRTASAQKPWGSIPPKNVCGARAARPYSLVPNGKSRDDGAT